MGEKKIERFLTLDEAAEFLGKMSPSTLRQKVARGMIRAYKPGKHVVFDPADLRDFVRRRPVR